MIEKEKLLKLIENWSWNKAKKHIDELYTILERSDNSRLSVYANATPKLCPTCKGDKLNTYQSTQGGADMYECKSCGHNF